LDGSPIVDPYFRQWLPNFSNIRAHCGIRSGLQKPGMKSCGVCALGCSAFRGSDRFTVTKSVQEGRGISLSRRDLPVISALVAIRQGQAAVAQRRLFGDVEPQWVEVDLKRIAVERKRAFGGPWLGLELCRCVGLVDFIERTLPTGKEEIPWPVMAQILILARLVIPAASCISPSTFMNPVL
jgi:hypothetical protein